MAPCAYVIVNKLVYSKHIINIIIYELIAPIAHIIYEFIAPILIINGINRWYIKSILQKTRSIPDIRQSGSGEADKADYKKGRNTASHTW